MDKRIFTILMVTVFIFALGLEVGLSKEKDKDQTDTAKIVLKLDEIIANQAKILEQLDQLKQELAIIKIRCTR